MASLLLSTHEVAERCGVTSKTVGRWVDSGVLAAIFTTGGHRRVLAEDVDRFMTDRRSLKAREATGSMLRVTLVTDDPACRAAVAAAARILGVGVAMRVADDGFSAGLLVADFWPHLVIVDGELAGVDVRRLCRRLREASPTQSATVAAIAPSEAARGALVAAGAHHILVKPLGQDDMRRVLEDAEGRRASA